MKALSVNVVNGLGIQTYKIPVWLDEGRAITAAASALSWLIPGSRIVLSCSDVPGDKIYDTIGQRNVDIPVPVDGDLCFVILEGRFYRGVGGSWTDYAVPDVNFSGGGVDGDGDGGDSIDSYFPAFGKVYTETTTFYNDWGIWKPGNEAAAALPQVINGDMTTGVDYPGWFDITRFRFRATSPGDLNGVRVTFHGANNQGLTYPGNDVYTKVFTGNETPDADGWYVFNLPKSTPGLVNKYRSIRNVRVAASQESLQGKSEYPIVAFEVYSNTEQPIGGLSVFPVKNDVRYNTTIQYRMLQSRVIGSFANNRVSKIVVNTPGMVSPNGKFEFEGAFGGLLRVEYTQQGNPPAVPGMSLDLIDLGGKLAESYNSNNPSLGGLALNEMVIRASEIRVPTDMGVYYYLGLVKGVEGDTIIPANGGGFVSGIMDNAPHDTGFVIEFKGRYSSSAVPLNVIEFFDGSESLLSVDEVKYVVRGRDQKF